MNRFVTRLPKRQAYLSLSLSLEPRSLTATYNYQAPCASQLVPQRCISALSEHQPVTRRQQAPSYALSCSSAQKNMSSATTAASAADLSSVVNPELLARLRDFWFSHMPDDDAVVLPQFEQTKRWFMGGEEFDVACTNGFKEPLEAIKNSQATADDVIATAKPSTGEDWLALILLHDQMPRNCYRGAASSVVFNVFDPIARSLSSRALEQGIHTSPGFKYHAGRRMWFYLPLMHSEDLATHDRAVQLYEEMADDFRALMATSPEDLASEEERKCREVVVRNREGTEKFLAMNSEFEKKHRDIIARFGRYPHRNGPLGREMTADEKKYLDEGGETFSGEDKKE